MWVINSSSCFDSCFSVCLYHYHNVCINMWLCAVADQLFPQSAEQIQTIFIKICLENTEAVLVTHSYVIFPDS